MRRHRGFTLIELLVVLIIIGVIVSLTIMSIGDNRGEELQREARRLNAVIELAAEEAILRSQPIGIRFDYDRYAFKFLDGERWTDAEHDRFLRPHTLPEPLQLDLVVDGLAANNEEGSRDQPQILLLTSGEMTPFELVVSHPDLDERYLIVGSLDGRLEFQRDD
ncbi:type II secretion system protein GspH [Alkalilimnicola ehrlichii]|uniref:Type II secretion system protein H n=1 Tax=Alkalilimnicola ehrlichii TaxID=351052 RepID=A0A3E0X101_9GAMM|nr:type II secretion system minor pseudopilin GspH [Alkalilimnicola ehrlichii]RFA31428.1 type II secretion system protein GspH [Alkalilimnicola ehrlichii]RFA39301.1 type II secretion system protein GspH [Alkalilimnicola ehrlichii]